MTQAILDNSQSAYAQLLASASLIRLVTEHTIRYPPFLRSRLSALQAGLCMRATLDTGLCPCSVPVKLDMRNYFLTYLDR
jgi:hypothetical protein